MKLKLPNNSKSLKMEALKPFWNVETKIMRVLAVRIYENMFLLRKFYSFTVKPITMKQ
jgi:hypothetical protein